MNKSKIMELVGDGSCYMEKIRVSDNEEYNKYQEELNEMYEKLCGNMGEKEKHGILWKLNLAQGGLEAVTADIYFKEGFKLGLILGAQNFLE